MLGVPIKIISICRILAILTLLPCALFAQEQAQVKVTVLDSTENPIKGVTLRLFPDQHTGITTDDGVFVFDRVFVGEYTLQADMLGYETVSRTFMVSNSSDNNIRLTMVPSGSTIEEVGVIGKVGNPDNLIDIRTAAMPVKIITRREIELMGSRRLDEILREQTGVAMVNDIGSGGRAVGVQMQGFSSQYIMVLVDGQPMVGRNNGNLDLSRISVTNVERIEIIKGATSCLYGSEALGGAINIITRHGAVQPQARVAVFYGTHNMLDATIEGETPFYDQRGSALLTANYYRFDGYNTDRKYIANGQTIPPSKNLSLQSRIRYQINSTHTTGIQGRYSSRRSESNQGFGNGNELNNNLDNLKDDELNLTLHLNSNYVNGLRSMTRYYFTHFNTTMQMIREGNQALLSDNTFKEYNHRLEQQFAYNFTSTLKLISGIGGNVSSMNDVSLSAPDPIYNGFAYLQAEWLPYDRLNFVGGLRYDYAGTYGGQVSPSLGIQYRVMDDLTLKAGFGRGFIAPDFKKRFQIFYNGMQGYTVMGAEVVKQGLQQLQDAGEISEIREYTLKNLPDRLSPESSTSFNAGLTYTPFEKVQIEGSWFYHNQYNFINTLQIATKVNNDQIYTYENIAKAYNTGVEFSLTYRPTSRLDLNTGYQLLITKNKGIISGIENGDYPYNNIRDVQTGYDRRTTPADYIGLWNRSKHMLNLNATYRFPWNLSLTARANYRSKYGFDDGNYNGFYDKYDIQVAGHVIVYTSVEKRFNNDHLSIIATGENLFDYVDRLIPGQMGRMLTAGVTYRFFKD